MKARRPRPYAPPVASARIYVRLESGHIALLKYLLEAEDNLALPTVVDRFAAVVRLAFSPDAAERVEGFVRDLTAVCPETIVCFRPMPGDPVARSPTVA